MWVLFVKWAVVENESSDMRPNEMMSDLILERSTKASNTQHHRYHAAAEVWVTSQKSVLALTSLQQWHKLTSKGCNFSQTPWNGWIMSPRPPLLLFLCLFGFCKWTRALRAAVSYQVVPAHQKRNYLWGVRFEPPFLCLHVLTCLKIEIITSKLSWQVGVLVCTGPIDVYWQEIKDLVTFRFNQNSDSGDNHVTAHLTYVAPKKIICVYTSVAVGICNIGFPVKSWTHVAIRINVMTAVAVASTAMVLNLFWINGSLTR